MSKAFGTDFIVVNDVQQILDPKVFGGGPWLHLATVKRGLKEYMAFKRVDAHYDPLNPLKGEEVWVEEIDPHTVNLKKIEDDAEWYDVVHFLKAAMLLETGSRRETHIDQALTLRD